MKTSVGASSGRLLIALSCAAIAAACSKKEEAPAAPAEPEIMVEEAEVDDAAPIGSADITVTLTNGAPAFGTVSEGACAPGGSCVGGINMNAAGNVDLSGFPPGDITINVNLDSTVTGAGYSFPSDPYQAVAIAVIPPNSTTAPIPVFGQANWPAEFDAPSVASATLSFVDKEDDQQAYEYSIQLQGPNGMMVMDPKIQNKVETK
jgi:predicted component of type VI protein secretion system